MTGSAWSTPWRRRVAAAVLIVVLAVSSSSCGAPVEDLSKALEQTQAGVHTVQLAVDSLGRGRSSRALVEVAASDAADEIAGPNARPVRCRSRPPRSARHVPGRWLRSTRLERWCSTHARASFFGYERSEVDRPWPLAQLLRWRERRAFLVLWADIELLSPGGVLLRPGARRWSPQLPPAPTAARR